MSEVQLDDLEIQGFGSFLRKLAQGIGTGVDIGRGLGLFQAGQPTSPQFTDLEIQGFGSFLRKLAQGIGTGVDIGRGLGLFQAGQPATGLNANNITSEQLKGLLQQALPALRASVQQQQMAGQPQ